MPSPTTFLISTFYARITPGKLGYLLHHRGHTHTLGIGLVLGAVTFLLVNAVSRRFGWRRRAVRAGASCSCRLLAGPWVHVGMIFNSYGAPAPGRSVGPAFTATRC